MEQTVYAAWLNDVFSLFDSFVLGLHHELALAYGDTLTPIADALGQAGHFGIMFIILGVFLLFFRQTRMTGFAILLSIAIAGALSEFVIKDIVDRPRPFEASDTFNAWWQFVGSPEAHSSSFPSGHVAGATAAMIALAYGARRWWVSLLGVLMVLVMMIDRMYLMVHYPSDVLAGFILGFLSGIVGYAIIQGIWRLMGKHPDQIAERKAAASRHGAVAGAAAGAGYGYGQPGYPAGAMGAPGAAGQGAPGAAGPAGARGAASAPRTPSTGVALGENAGEYDLGDYAPRQMDMGRGGRPARNATAGAAGQGAAGAAGAPTQRMAPASTASATPAAADAVKEILDDNDILIDRINTSSGYKTPANPLFKNQGGGAGAGAAGAGGAPQGTGRINRAGATGSMPAADGNRPKPGAYSAAVEKHDQDDNLTLEDFRRK